MSAVEEFDVEGEYSDLLFGVERSILYHNKRRAFYENLRFTKNLLSLIFGAGAVGGMLAKVWDGFTIIAAALVTILSLIDLLTNTASREVLHTDLANNFIELEQEMVAVKGRTEEDVRRWKQKRLEIEKKEPPKRAILDSMCHNELCRSMGYGEEECVDIKPWQRAIAQFSNIGEHTITKKAQQQLPESKNRALNP